jgi:hypothetical protein
VTKNTQIKEQNKQTGTNARESVIRFDRGVEKRVKERETREEAASQKQTTRTPFSFSGAFVRSGTGFSNVEENEHERTLK